MEVRATPEAIALVRASGGRLYVWPERSSGCQPLTVLAASAQAAPGRAFARVPFATFELYFAVTPGSAVPRELGLDLHRARVRATWDGAAWAL